MSDPMLNLTQWTRYLYCKLILSVAFRSAVGKGVSEEHSRLISKVPWYWSEIGSVPCRAPSNSRKSPQVFITLQHRVLVPSRHLPHSRPTNLDLALRSIS